MHQSTTPSLSQSIWARWASRQFLSLPIVQTLLPVTFGYSLSSEAVVMRQLRRWKRLWRRLRTRTHKRASMGPCRSCWNGTTSALQPEEITSMGTSFMCVPSIKVPIRKKSGNLFNDPRKIPRNGILSLFAQTVRSWRETESLLIAFQNDAIKTNSVKAKIDKTQENGGNMRGEREREILNSECSKVAQKYDWVEKVTHWELCKWVKFDHTWKWYMHKPGSVLENERCKFSGTLR